MANKVKITTPTGVLGFSYLTKEDPKFGGYKTRIAIVPGEGQDLIVATCKALAKEALNVEDISTIKLPYDMDEEGNLVLKANTKHEPALYDSLGHQMTSRPMVGAGSLCRLKASLKAYNGSNGKGITCYLNAVQVAKIGGMEQFGAMDDIEDGFVEGDGDAEPFENLLEAAVKDNREAIGDPTDF